MKTSDIITLAAILVPASIGVLFSSSISDFLKWLLIRPIDESRWQTQFKSDDGTFKYQSLDGVSDDEAPLPRRLHLCTPQARGWDLFDLTERCACGAINRNGRGWRERNSRRKRARRHVRVMDRLTQKVH